MCRAGSCRKQNKERTKVHAGVRAAAESGVGTMGGEVCRVSLE